MKFLVDENLPLALVRWLRTRSFEADHTSALGLSAAPDLDIARAAPQMNAVIVTKDNDYIAFARSGRGPRVVHVRSGNASTDQLLTLCGRVRPDVSASLDAGDLVIEIGSAR